MAVTDEANEETPEQAPIQAPVSDGELAPIWLPDHDAIVVDHSQAGPPHEIDGYGPVDRLATLLLGGGGKTALTIAGTIAVLLFLWTVPQLELGVSSLVRMSLLQGWTMGLLLLATIRVRSFSISALACSWLAGMFGVSLLMHFASGPLSGLADRPEVWVYPLLEFLALVITLAVIVVAGRRFWRHPGVADFAALGFAIGGGYAFHAAGVRGEPSAHGLDSGMGFLLPSILRVDGYLAAGHAVWAAMFAIGLGMLLLNRTEAIAVVAGVTLMMWAVLDRMAFADSEGTLGWVRSFTFDGTLTALAFVAAIAGAIYLDHSRLKSVGERDHLLPPDTTRSSTGDDDDDLLLGLRVGRYRRRRHGLYNTVSASQRQWPPRSAANPPPLADLARLGRSAGVGIGPGTSAVGWAPDPDHVGRFRFAGPYGFTPFGAGQSPDLSTAHAAPVDPSLMSISDRAGGSQRRFTHQRRPADFVSRFAIAAIVLVVYTMLRLVTAGDQPEELASAALHLPDAISSPAVITTAIGAFASLATLVGRAPQQPGPGWSSGPGDDPSPRRPRECEA